MVSERQTVVHHNVPHSNVCILCLTRELLCRSYTAMFLWLTWSESYYAGPTQRYFYHLLDQRVMFLSLAWSEIYYAGPTLRCFYHLNEKSYYAGFTQRCFYHLPDQSVIKQVVAIFLSITGPQHYHAEWCFYHLLDQRAIVQVSRSDVSITYLTRELLCRSHTAMFLSLTWPESYYAGPTQRCFHHYSNCSTPWSLN